MDAPVGDQAFEGKPGNLAAHRVERRNRHGLGGVVDDDVDAGDGLEGADVAAVPADDAALHVVGRQGDHGHGGLGDDLGGEPLNGRGEDAAGAAIGLFPSLDLEVAHQDHRLAARLVLHLGEQLGLGGPRVEAGDALERRARFLLDFLDLGPQVGDLPLPLDQELLPGGEVGGSLLERGFPLGHALLRRADLEPAVLEGRLLTVAIGLGLGAPLVLGPDEHLLGLETGFADEPLRRDAGPAGAPLLRHAAHHEASGHPRRQGGQHKHELHVVPNPGSERGRAEPVARHTHSRTSHGGSFPRRFGTSWRSGSVHIGLLFRFQVQRVCVVHPILDDRPLT